MQTGFIKFLNKPISPPRVEHGYSEHIEQYRGLCALLVLMAHGFGDDQFLLTNFKWPAFVHYLNSGYLSVMVFFCISGYVIGISNDKPKLKFKSYLQKRVIRLYPVYLAAITLCLFITTAVTFFVLLGNMLFLQNSASYLNVKIPTFVNYPAWSLNFEALYYLLFLLLFYFKPKLWVLFTVLLVISLSMLHCPNSIQFLVIYVNGYYFWVMGLIVAWNFFPSWNKTKVPIPLLSILFLHLCINHLGIGEIILHVIHVYSTTNINWLFDLPFCLMVITSLTNKKSTFLKFNKVFCYVLPIFIFLFLSIRHRIFENTRWVMCLIFWVLSLVFYVEKKVSTYLLRKLTSVGKISYALYLVHVPLALLIKKTIFINNLRIEVLVKYSLWLFLTFSISYILEILIQPIIKKRLLPV